MKKPHTHKQGEKGFVALVSTLLISSVLIVLMYTTSTGSFYSRLDSMGSEFKRVSVGLSEACSNAALLKIAQDYNYTPAVGGDIITVGPDTCLIQEVVHGVENPTTYRKPISIQTIAEYPDTGGSWSSTRIQAMVQNPARSTTVPAPTCSFNSNTNTLNMGQAVTLGWAVAGNATDFLVSRQMTGATTTIYSGSPTGSPIQDTPTNSATYSAIITGPGGSTQCQSPQSISVQPAPDCADVVLMLDRTGSMTSADLSNEQTAAKGLIDLYDTVNPTPKLGIGRFGISSGNSNAEVQTRGQLTVNYGDDDIGTDFDNDLYDAAEEATVSGSNVYTNLASAVSIGDSELNSGRHTSGKGKVLILISDGEPNRPCSDGSEGCGASVTTFAKNAATNAANTAKASHGIDNLPTEIFTIHFGSAGTNDTNKHFLASLASYNSLYGSGVLSTDTGFLPPTQNAGSWSSNVTGAYADGGAVASNNLGQQHRYYNFDLDVPVGSTIDGIEISADAWSTHVSSPISLLSESFGTGSTNSNVALPGFDWDENGSGTQVLAPGSGNDSASPSGGRFAFIDGNGGWICRSLSAGGLGSPQLSYQWRGDANAESGDNGIVEYKIGGDCDDGGWSQIQNHDLSNDVSWSTQNAFSLPSSIESATFLIRFRSASSNSDEDFRVDGISISGNSACQLGVELSSNLSSATPTWTSQQRRSLSGAEDQYVFGGSDGSTNALWNRGWISTSFSNVNFAVRVTDFDPGNNCTNTATTNLDWLRAKVHYTTPANDTAENTDDDHFFVAPTSSDMPAIFETIGELACPALIPPAPPGPLPPPPAPPAPPPPISIGAWDEIIIAP